MMKQTVKGIQSLYELKQENRTGKLSNCDRSCEHTSNPAYQAYTQHTKTVTNKTKAIYRESLEPKPKQ